MTNPQENVQQNQPSQENSPQTPSVAVSSTETHKVELTRSSTSPGPKPTRTPDGDVKPRITVVGVGGAGCNAVNNMIRSQLEGVEFSVMNTDAQALQQSLADRRVHLGDELTQGLGAGSSPDTGRAAAEESHDIISKEIRGSNMVFIAAGMGGGTGTGSAPVIARVARDLGILTVGVVTKPFNFEGAHRMRTAEKGIEELQKAVDTLIVIPNQNLFRVANENTTFADAFKMADDVLYAGVRSITDLMIMPGLINLDFADVRTVMSEMGKAMMGTGEADGEGRAIAAAEAAISNPLLDDVSVCGAQGVLISITGGMDMTLFEVDEAANRIREEVEVDANIIFGSTFDDRLNGRVRVSVVATGIDGIPQTQQTARSLHKQTADAPKPQASHPQEQAQQGAHPQSSPEGPSHRLVLDLSDDGNEYEDHTTEETDTKSEHTLKIGANPEQDLDNTSDRDHDLLERETSPHPNLFDDDTSYEGQDRVESLVESNSQPEQEGSQDPDPLHTSQMEIKFDAPEAESSAHPQAPKKKGGLSAGNFLSRFLKGRSKDAQPKATPTFSTSPSDQRGPNPAENDELDVPTFMRQGNKKD